MLTRTLLIFIFSLSVTLNLSAQSYNFHNYTVGDGLAGSRVHAITQDNFGNLWIGTQGGGVSRYNGVDFKNYTIRDGLASNFIRSMVTDGRGRVWMATANGISKIEGETIKNYPIVMDDEERKSVLTIESTQDDKVWIAHSNGNIYYVENDSLYQHAVKFENNIQVIDLAEDGNGQLWGVTNTSSVFTLDADSLTYHYHRGEAGVFILSLTFRQTEMFFCTNKGLIRYDQDSESHNDILKDVFIQQSLTDNQGETWFISTLGLMSLDMNNEIIHYNSSNGFSDEMVKTIFTDSEGTIWFGTDGDGIYKLTGSAFSKYDTSHGLGGNNITSILRDSTDRVWFTTSANGISYYQNGEFKVLNSSNRLSNDFFTSSVLLENGEIWFGTMNLGILRYRNNQFTILDKGSGLGDDRIRSLYRDQKNRIWIGTQGGLVMYDGKDFHSISHPLLNENIWAINEAPDIGVYFISRKGVLAFKDSLSESSLIPEDLLTQRINTVLYEPDKGFWIAYSGHGLLLWDNKTNEKTYYNTDDGLSSDIIHSIIHDSENNVMVGTDNGIDKLFLDEEKRVTKVKSYRNNNAFVGINALPNSHFIEKDGSIWFGSTVGAFRYNPEKESINARPPITYISEVKLNYLETEWSQYSDNLDPWTGLPSELKLNYKDNNIVFGFFGNSLSDAERIRYQIKMENIDRDWSPAIANREVAYSNLSPGRYEFKVRAKNSDGLWSATPALFAFEIIPPFWQRLWFYILLFIILAILMKVLYDYRVKIRLNKLLEVDKIREEEQIKVRKRMARDFHDNMGNQLASITVFTNLINIKLKDQSDEVNNLLGNIEKHTQSLFNGTKDFIWSMDPASDELNEIYTYLKDFGEELFDRSSTRFYSSISGKIRNKMPLKSGANRHLVLIFKEAMTNALKHSQASTCHLTMNISRKNFVISFKDDGVGRTDNRSHYGKGLKNMASRAQEIGCSVEFPISGNGFEVVLNGTIETELNN